MSTKDILGIIVTILCGIGTLYVVFLYFQTRRWLRQIDAEIEREKQEPLFQNRSETPSTSPRNGQSEADHEEPANPTPTTR